MKVQFAVLTSLLMGFAAPSLFAADLNFVINCQRATNHSQADRFRFTGAGDPDRNTFRLMVEKTRPDMSFQRTTFETFRNVSRPISDHGATAYTQEILNAEREEIGYISIYRRREVRVLDIHLHGHGNLDTRGTLTDYNCSVTN